MKRILKIISLLTIIAVLMVPAHMSLAKDKQDGKESITTKNTEKIQDTEERLEGAIILYIKSPRAIVDNVEKSVDSTNNQVVPFIKNDRTLVPVRFISENMGAKVGWEASTSTVTVEGEGVVVQLVIGSKTMKVGSKEVELDVAPEIFEGRTYLPLRSLAEALGKEVFYDRGLIVISDKKNIFNVETEKDLIDEIISRVTNLPRISSYQELEELIKNSASNAVGNSPVRGEVMLEMEDAIAAESSVSSQNQNSMAAGAKNDMVKEATGSDDYSTTNVQVQGVDEADVVKTDGEFIYQVNKNRIIVAKAYPYANMEIESVVNFKDENFTPMEIYIDGERLVVIGSYYEDVIYNNTPYEGSSVKSIDATILPYFPHKTTVKAIIFDISDKSDIKNIRNIEVEGSYISSRKIDSTVYLIANKYVDTYYLQEEKIQLPCYKDTAVSDEYIDVDYIDIRYFPQFVQPQYLTIASFDIKNNESANIETYLGSGENIYASSENLYVAVTNYQYILEERPIIRDSEVDILIQEPMPVEYKDDTTTNIYKFSLNEGNVTYLNSGEVPGTILNQFSMDEYNGYFRIATTTGNMWAMGENASKNNIYILDDTMNITGKVEGIAPQERIYSARFMGDRGYMVTFRQVDPFFVIDLKDPYNPKILGELKIPGYSDYLHPYDENHIIGFGMDTVEVHGGALMEGMKIALFDVTDVNNPVQKFSETIGSRGTNSELLRNHKALLFSKDKNLLAFPISVVEENNRYGQPSFQGAYVYNIDEENGFVLKGKITHITSEDYKNKEYYYYSYDKHIERILFINDTLYTLSQGMIKANDIENLDERNQLIIPE